MSAAPEFENPEAAAASIATDTDTVTPTADTLPVVDVPLRVPTLEGRWVRARTVWEVRTRLLVDGETETRLFRREGAAHGYAARLRAQGYPVAISRGVISWERRAKPVPVEPTPEPTVDEATDDEATDEVAR